MDRVKTITGIKKWGPMTAFTQTWFSIVSTANRRTRPL